MGPTAQKNISLVIKQPLLLEKYTQAAFLLPPFALFSFTPPHVCFLRSFAVVVDRYAHPRPPLILIPFYPCHCPRCAVVAPTFCRSFLRLALRSLLPPLLFSKLAVRLHDDGLSHTHTQNESFFTLYYHIHTHIHAHMYPFPQSRLPFFLPSQNISHLPSHMPSLPSSAPRRHLPFLSTPK